MMLHSKFFRSTSLGIILLQFKREMIGIAVFSAVINLLMLSPTLYMLQVMDRVMLSRSELTLLVLSLLVLFFYVVQAFSEVIRSRLIIGSGLKFDAALSEPIFRATFAEQLKQKGRAPAQGFEDLMTIRQWLTGQAVFAFFDLPWAPLYLAVMFMLHPMLGWLTILFMLLLAAFAWWTSRATRELNDESEQEGLELNSFIHTKLKNVEVIEAHGMTGNLLKRWWSRQQEHLKIQDKAKDVEERFSISSKEIRTFMQSLALAAGAWLAIRGEISVATMIAGNLLMSRATSPIDQIVGGWKSFTSVQNSFRRIERLLKSGEQVPVNQTIDDVTPTAPVDEIRLHLQDVSASVEGRTEPILRDINIEFFPGQIHVILGASGAGKSTLGRVLAGVWPEYQGKVQINGIDIRAMDRAALGAKIGFLPQDIELFAGSIGENIARMGVPDSDQVIEAAKLTGTHDLLLHMPQGYDSPIGEGGGYLSGGQRQRVALTRALYGNPKLLILDEPNANLDEAGEAALAGALQEMKKRGATIVAITHRPALTEIADRLVIMEAGRILVNETADKARAQIAAYLSPEKITQANKT